MSELNGISKAVDGIEKKMEAISEEIDGIEKVIPTSVIETRNNRCLCFTNGVLHTCLWLLCRPTAFCTCKLKRWLQSGF